MARATATHRLSIEPHAAAFVRVRRDQHRQQQRYALHLLQCTNQSPALTTRMSCAVYVNAVMAVYALLNPSSHAWRTDIPLVLVLP